MTRNFDDDLQTIQSTQPEQIKIDVLESSKNILEKILKTLNEGKAENILTIDLQSQCALGDYMVIASAQSSRHVIALADQLLRVLKSNKTGSAQIEGLENGQWILLDLGDVIVHLFLHEIREFYNIEKMWLNENNNINISTYS